MKILYYYLSVAVLLVIFGCGADEEKRDPIDRESPTMEIEKPVSNALIGKGTDLLLSGVFNDDLELENIELSLSFIQTKAENGITDPWTPSPETILLSHTRQVLTDEKLFGESVPLDCKSGAYKLRIVVNDKAGKSIVKEILIEID